MVAWKLSILRCCLYGGIVAWGVWKSGTEGFDHFSDMTGMQKIDMFGDMAVGFGGVILAFLDTSIQNLSRANGVDGAQITTQTQTTVKTTP